MAIERMMSTASVTCRSLPVAGCVASASTSTGSASEAGRPDDEVPTTCSLSRPGWACGTTTDVWNFPSELMTAEPTTTRLGSSTTILTWLFGLNPAPLSATRWPALAWLGAETTGVAEMPGGAWRVVDVVRRLGVVVVVVLVDVVEEAGAVVEVVEAGGLVVEVVERADAVTTVEAVDVVEGAAVPEVTGVVRPVGFTTCGMVVDVVEVGVMGVVVVVVLLPVTVLGGVWFAWAPAPDVVGTVLGTAPGGVCGLVVVVVGKLVALVGSPAGAEVLVVDDGADVVDEAVVVDVVELVVAGDVVVVVPVVVVTDEVGTVVVALVVVVVAATVVVVAGAVVLVVVDDGGCAGVDKGVVSASAGPPGTNIMARPSAVVNTAAQNVATSRASQLLELWRDKRIRAPTFASQASAIPARRSTMIAPVGSPPPFFAR
jgi:hypothetical protein